MKCSATQELDFLRDRQCCLKIIYISPNRGKNQAPHPREGEHGGGLKPPDPLGMPWARKFPADISFSTLADRHPGHDGAFLSEGKKSSSNSRPHSLQTNSNIGIVISLRVWKSLTEYKSRLSGQLLSLSVPFIIHIQQFKYKIAFVKFHQAILFYRDQAQPGVQLFLDA